MEKWVVYAFISMIFAGFTSVIAKLGLNGISGEFGLVVRTCFVFFLVLAFAFFAVPRQEISTLTQTNIAWLAASGVTTAIADMGSFTLAPAGGKAKDFIGKFTG